MSFEEMEKIEHSTVITNGIRMHVASIGRGAVVLFLHGFPELWYSWRHQLLSLSSRGYRAIAPDLRGYGGTEAPPSVTSYTALHIVGDLVGLLDELGIEQVFLVGHDWGAMIAWYFCLFRPDRIKALVNLSVPFIPRNPAGKLVDSFRRAHGDNFYICRFQKEGEAEEDFAQVDTAKLMKKILAYRKPEPFIFPEGQGFSSLPDPPTLPSWLSEGDIGHYAKIFKEKGFTGGLNYYRCLDQNWELTAPWTGAQVKVPVKFIIGDLDLTYEFHGMKDYIHGAFKKDVPLLDDVVVMEGVGHFINQEKPEEISEHIYDFIKKF